jgi:iron-sulfur cluster assembly accessory protein
MKPIISMCEKAKNHFTRLSKLKKNENLLFSVKGGGCNGLKYSVESLEDEVGKFDEVVDFTDFKLVVCGKSLMYILGTHITWKEDEFGSSIHFENPNADSKCGCGETFNIK